MQDNERKEGSRRESGQIGQKTRNTKQKYGRHYVEYRQRGRQNPLIKVITIRNTEDAV